MKYQDVYDDFRTRGDQYVHAALDCYSDEDFDAEVEEYEDTDEFFADLRVEGMIAMSYDKEL